VLSQTKGPAIVVVVEMFLVLHHFQTHV